MKNVECFTEIRVSSGSEEENESIPKQADDVACRQYAQFSGQSSVQPESEAGEKEIEKQKYYGGFDVDEAERCNHAQRDYHQEKSRSQANAGNSFSVHLLLPSPLLAAIENSSRKYFYIVESLVSNLEIHRIRQQGQFMPRLAASAGAPMAFRC